jgi:hypothetical protein
MKKHTKNRLALPAIATLAGCCLTTQAMGATIINDPTSAQKY